MMKEDSHPWKLSNHITKNQFLHKLNYRNKKMDGKYLVLTRSSWNTLRCISLFFTTNHSIHEYTLCPTFLRRSDQEGRQKSLLDWDAEVDFASNSQFYSSSIINSYWCQFVITSEVARTGMDWGMSMMVWEFSPLFGTAGYGREILDIIIKIY